MTRWLAVGIAAWFCAGALRAQSDGRVSATTAIYVRTDSDRTTVVSPRVHVTAPLGPDSQTELVYTADVWSSASIDIRTAASQRVIEQRDEIDVSLAHTLSELRVSGGYRYSIEHDYESHGGRIGARWELAQRNTTLAASVQVLRDQIGRAGDAAFQRELAIVSGRFSVAQVIDPRTLAELVYEFGRYSGYQSSPYRYVRVAAGAAPEQPSCGAPDAACEAENNPNRRLRHAVAAYLRRALGDAFSLGAGYRFYRDDWDLESHTALIDLGWLPLEGWLLSLQYRFYLQSSASHYRSYYAAMPFPVLRTSDKELSAFTSHRLALEFGRDVELDERGARLAIVLRAAPALFVYRDVPLLDTVRALELTLSLELRL